MKHKRGFRADANWYARTMREELGIEPSGPLCPWRLTTHLGYDVVPLSEFAAAQPEAVTYLRSTSGQDEFSAITLFGAGNPCIIHNDFQHARRQAANLAHEAAHGLLCHKPVPFIGPDGLRNFDQEQEDEAAWLGPALLVSEEAALHIVESGLAPALVRAIYGVSDQLLRMRLAVTNASVRVARRAARLKVG